MKIKKHTGNVTHRGKGWAYTMVCSDSAIIMTHRDNVEHRVKQLDTVLY